MKKRLMVFILVLFSVNTVMASLSLSPAKFEIDFAPGLEVMYNFNAFSDSGKVLEVFSAGEFSEYVKFDKTELLGGGDFIATLKLPDEAAKPGVNSLYIGVKEKPEANSGVGTSITVRALINIRVPYPGKYPEITSFSVDTVSAGDDSYMRAGVASRGKEDVTLNTKFVTFLDGKEFDSIAFSPANVKSGETYNYEHLLDKNKYKAGNYEAKLVVDYDGKNAEKNTNFRIGTLEMHILNWTKELKVGGISPFIITTESSWNNKIDGVYAIVNITAINKTFISSFKTVSVDFAPFQKQNLSGYVDAKELAAGDYIVKMTLYYADKSAEIESIVKVYGSKSNMLIVTIAIILAVLITALIIFFRRKNEKEKKK